MPTKLYFLRADCVLLEDEPTQLDLFVRAENEAEAIGYWRAWASDFCDFEEKWNVDRRAILTPKPGDRRSNLTPLIRGSGDCLSLRRERRLGDEGRGYDCAHQARVLYPRPLDQGDRP
jgi:hypothetical protein